MNAARCTFTPLLTVFLLGVLGVLVWVIFEEAIRFDPSLAFDISVLPSDLGTALGIGMGFAIYSYLDYYI